MKNQLEQIFARLLCVSLLAGSMADSQATSFTWDNTAGGSWASQANWSTGTLPTTVNDTANFSTLDLTAAATVTLDGNQFIDQMLFGDTVTNTAFGWVVGAGTPSTSSLIFGGANPTINVNALGGASFVDVTATLAATNLTKTGPGTLRITPVGLVLNGLTIAGGTVNTVSGANFGVGTLTFSGNGTFGAGTSASYTPTFNAITNAAGVSSTINLGAGRGQLGTTTAPCSIGGNLTITIGPQQASPSRVYMAGTWRNDSGSPATLNLVGTAVNGYISPTFNGTGGNTAFNSVLTNVTLNLSSSSPGVNKVYVNPHNNSGGNTFSVGALSGTGDGILTSDGVGPGTTYSVGALGISTTFGGQFLGDASLTKIGAGTLTLTNNSTIGVNSANAVNVTGGKLVGMTGGSFLAPSFNVANGATNGVQVATTGGQWITTNLVYATGTNYLEFNFATTTPSTSVAPLLTTNLTINSISNVISVVGGANWAVGTYPLIKYTGTFAGSGGFAAVGLGALPLRVVATLNNNVANHSIDLVVSAVNEPLHWAAGNGNWDIATTVNWQDAASVSSTYQEQLGLGDQVLFNDLASGSSPIAITLNTGVTPASVTFSNVAKNYTLAGSGGILGTIGLTKAGAGTLTLQNTNSFTGAVNLNGGVVNFNNLNNNFGGGTAINFNGGTLQYASGNTADISGRTVTLNAGGATIDTAGNNVAFANHIGGSGAGSLTKTGAGTLTLNTNGTYSGATLVNQGTLALGANTSLSNSAAVVVGAGAVLDASATGFGFDLNGTGGQLLAGTGSVNGSVTTSGGAKLSPATNGVIGTLTFNNDLTLNGGTFNFDLNASSHDLIVVGGNLNLNATASGTVQINALALLTLNSTNKLFQYPAGQLTGGGISTLSLAVSGVTQTGRLLSLDNSVDGEIDLVVHPAAANNLVWQGDGGANAWDVSSANWIGASGIYSDGDNANFTDAGAANSPVNITAAVTPNSVTFNATLPYTLTGAKITGAATLTKTNSGTVILANVGNDYGMTVIQAGTLQIGDGSTGGTSIGLGTVTNNAALVFNQPDNSSVAGDINGTGSLSKQGAGTLTLLGNSAYAGTTAVDTGVLQVGNGGVAGTLAAGAVTLSNGGTLDLNTSGAYTLANTITGAGTLKFDGAATVTYAGGKSYLDNTYIDNGTVKPAAANVIPSGGSTTGWLVLDGGVSAAGALDLNGFNQSVNALSGLGNSVLGRIYNNGSGLNTLSIGTIATTTYAGLILNNTNGGSGSVGLTITGDGSLATTLTLSGLNSYSGPVYIDGASVILGGSLATIGELAIGTGAVTLTNNGSLQMNGYGSATQAGSSFVNSVLVPAGTTGNLKTMGRGVYSGNITVHGTLNLTTSYVRSSPTGDWSASDGQINIIAGTAGGDVYLNNAGNISFGTAAMDLGAGVNVYNAANTGANGNIITIGELTGTGTISDTAAGTAGRVTTYQVGGRNSNATFAGTINNRTRITAINKVGTGAWTLNGSDTYTGPTTVTSGSLIVGSSSFMAASTLITVSNGAVLDVTSYGSLTLTAGQTVAGSGVITGAVVAVASDILSPGVGTAAGTLSFSNTLTIDGSSGFVTNNFNLSSDPTGLSKANSQVAVLGDLIVNGANVVTVNPLNTILGAGNYTLFTYTGALTTNGVAAGAGLLPDNFIAGGTFAANSHVSLTFSNTGSAIVMIVTPAGNSLVWQGGVFGTATNNWDLNLSTNWLAGTAATNFLAYDNVTFDNSATNFNAVLAGTLAPGSITVNSTNAFTFSGSGKISGSTGIAKSGTNVLTISNTGGNDYSGTVTITDGILKAGSATALGATNGATVVSGTGALDVGGQNLGAEPVTVSGSGIGSAGAIQNSGAAALNALQYVTLAGNTTFGGTNRWDIRANTNGSLAGNGFTLTKTSANDIYLVGLGNTALGNIQILQGRLGVQDSTFLGTGGTLSLAAGAGVDFWLTTVTNTKAVSLTNATLSSSSGTNVYGGPISLNGTGTFTATTPLQLTGALGGTGGLVKNGAAALTLTAASGYSGVTTVSNGVLALAGTASIAGSTAIEIESGAVLDVTAHTGGSVTLGSSQTLRGNGTVNGSVTAPAGSTVSPGVGGIGTLTITSTLTLGGSMVMEVNHDVVPTHDQIVATNIVYGGTLTVVNTGSALTLGDFFKLFAGANSGSFTTVTLPALDPGLVWTNTLALNGTISVVAGSTVNPAPTNLTATVSGNVLTLSWPADHTGWHLQVQTNNLAGGVSVNTNDWMSIPGSDLINSTNITIDASKPTEFYRMVLP